MPYDAHADEARMHRALCANICTEGAVIRFLNDLAQDYIRERDTAPPTPHTPTENQTP